MKFKNLLLICFSTLAAVKLITLRNKINLKKDINYFSDEDSLHDNQNDNNLLNVIINLIKIKKFNCFSKNL